MPLTSWATHVLQWVETKSSEPVKVSESHKTILSSDCGLQPAHMKSELLVIPNQNVGVNAFPGLVHTARHAMGVGGTRSRWANRKGAAA